MRNSNTKVLTTQKVILLGVFIAMGVVLSHVIPGRIFLPMHIPVLICGILCGLPYGIICGVATPLLSNLIFQMPPSFLLPPMVCELAAYGLFSSLFMLIPARELFMKIHFALIGSMLLGRVVYGAVEALIFNVGDYSLKIWLTEAFVTALPGIIIQIVLIPPVVMAVKKSVRDL